MEKESALEHSSNLFGLLSKYYLERLEDRWVKEITNSDFTDIVELPPEFLDIHSSTNFVGLLEATVSCLRDWIDLIPQSHTRQTKNSEDILTFLSTSSIYETDTEQRDIYSQFWMDLTKTFDMKAVLSFIFFWVYKGMSYDADEEARALGCLSSSLYLLLLSVPGSNAFRIFHSMLYLKCVDILRLTVKLNVGASSPKKGVRISKTAHRKSADDEVEEDEDDMSFLTPAEANKLVRSLNILLNDFLRFASRFSLKHSPESLEETISILIDVTRSETHNAQSIFLQRHNANSVTALSYNAYVALQNVCSPLHGNVEKTITFIMKSIMPNILTTARGSSDLSARGLTTIREHAVIFVKYLFIQIPKDAQRGVYVLLQHLCFRVTDRADFREKVAKSVIDILKILPVQLYIDFLKWLHNFSLSDKAGQRLFSLEVVSKLLEEEERNEEKEEVVIQRQSSDNNSFASIVTNHEIDKSMQQNVLSHRFLLEIILSRCSDSAATVRGKALALLARCTLSGSPTIIVAMKEIFCGEQLVGVIAPETSTDAVHHPQLPDKELLLSLLSRRSLDEKVTVRKSALQVMENLMKMDVSLVCEKHLQILEDHCRDPALLIRKQMISSLTGILEKYSDNKITCKVWVRAVLPLVLDPEIKVQEKVLEVVDAMVFSTLVPSDGSQSDQVSWTLINCITSQSYMKFFSKIIMLWCKTEFFKPNVFSVIKTHIGTKHNEQAWTLLGLMSQYMQVKSPLFALEYFEQHCQNISEISSHALQQVLKVLQHSIKHLSEHHAVSLKNQLVEHAQAFTLEVGLISLVIDSITLISKSLQNENEDDQQTNNWAVPLLQQCDSHLQEILFSTSNLVLNGDEEELFFRHLYTMGELSLLCPSKVNKRMFLMLQSLIFHNTHCKEHVDPIPSSQTQSSQPPAVSFAPTSRLKALAVLTLGKMCLQHENEAKRIIPALGKLLDTTTLPSIKINIIFVLADMCVRYATLVDPLMPQVTACLRDSDLQVRRTTLTLLINLLQEDYLKLKGSFFYRILQCLCDDHEDMRSTVAFYLTERLLKRSPNIFLQHFIECIFHYNCYEEHESYNKFSQSKQEREVFTLAGETYREQRMTLYKFMLDHMSDEQRFATTQKLCQDVLGGIVDAKIHLTPASQPMLEDTLLVLSSDEIKLASLKSRNGDLDQPTDREEQAAMAGLAMRKSIISQVVKQNVIENIVPILISLKHRLEEKRSPLMKQLLLYLKDIMKDYKNEVKEILAGDKQLAKEIEFDLRKIDEQQKQPEPIVPPPKPPTPPCEEPNNDTNQSNREAIPGTPIIQNGKREDLLEKALTNSRNVMQRRHSTMGVPNKTPLKRLSVDLIPIDTSHHNEEPLQNRRKELLRAISTPQGSRSILENITFVNKSQDMSTICFEKTQDQSDSAILLHLKSPEAFAKDDQFSMVRKGPRRSILKVFEQQPSTKSRKRALGLFESYSNSATEENLSNESSSNEINNLSEVRRSMRLRHQTPCKRDSSQSSDSKNSVKQPRKK